jgi:tripartite ATP-independent transporter DctP family solute receptor
MKNLITHAVTALVAVLVLTSGTMAAEKLKFAHVYETSAPYHKWAVWAAGEIGKRTQGRFAVDVFPASSLGKEVDINEGLSLGTVDMIYTGALFAGRSFGPIAISGSPFMFRDFAHWKAYTKSGLFRELGEGYRKVTGNHVVAMTYYGERHVTSNKPIRAPGDMKGLKIRVPNAPLYMMFPKAAGANPTPIAFAEVYLALQQGVVDAQENPLPTIQFKKFYEVQKYINLTGHITDALLTIVGGPLWKRLSAADRKIFTAVLKEASANCTADIVQAEKDLVAWFEGQGVKVLKVDRKPFRKAVVPYHLGPDATWPKDVYDRLQALK